MQALHHPGITLLTTVHLQQTESFRQLKGRANLLAGAVQSCNPTCKVEDTEITQEKGEGTLQGPDILTQATVGL